MTGHDGEDCVSGCKVRLRPMSQFDSRLLKFQCLLFLRDKTAHKPQSTIVRG